MKTIIELTSADMAKIIAERFKVPVEKVTIDPYITTEGYGMMETEVAKVRCEVEINKEV